MPPLVAVVTEDAAEPPRDADVRVVGTSPRETSDRELPVGWPLLGPDRPPVDLGALCFFTVICLSSLGGTGQGAGSEESARFSFIYYSTFTK